MATTTVVKSVGTSSRNYSTLQAWEDAAPVDLTVTRSNNCGTGSTTSAVVLDGSASGTDGAYTGLTITVASEERLITGYTGSTKTATIGALNGSSATLTSAPSSGTAFVINSVIWKGECYNDSEFFTNTTADTLRVQGSTTSTSCYKQITAAAGQSFQDHANVRTNPLRYDQSKGVGIRQGANYYSCIINYENAFHCSRLQLKAPVTLGGALRSSAAFASKNLLVENCIMMAGGGQDGYEVVILFQFDVMTNCAIMMTSNYNKQCVHLQSIQQIAIVNCTIMRTTDYSATGYGIYAQYFAANNIANTAIFGFTTPCYSADSGGSAKNATDQSSGLPGSGNVYSVSYSSTSPFKNASVASCDMRSVADTALAGAGDHGWGDYAGGGLDISGVERANPPYIGCWEPTYTVTKTIGTSSRNYSTIQAWEDACPADLTHKNYIWRGECYNDSEFTGGVTISGETVDAERYIELTVASGQSFQDHADVRTNALKYDQSKGVGWKITTAYATIFSPQVDYVRLSRFQIWHPYIFPEGTHEHIQLKDLLVYSSTAGATVGGLPDCLYVNILAINDTSSSTVGFSLDYCSSGSPTLIGCMAVRPTSRTAGGTGFRTGNYSAGILLKSCGCFGFTTVVTNTAKFSGSSGYNATDVASSGFPGSNNVYGVSYTRTTPFIDADTSSLDLRAKSGTSLESAGVRDSTNAPNDISKFARSATPTIGVWELLAAQSITNGTKSSSATLYAPTIGTFLTAATITSGNARYAPTVKYLISLAHKASGAVLYAPTVKQIVAGATIAAGNARYAPTVTYVVAMPTIAAGNARYAPTVKQLVTAATITSGAALYAPTTRYLVSLAVITNTPVVRVPTVVQSIAQPTITAGSAVYAPTCRYAISLPTRAAASVVYTPTGAYKVTTGTIAEGSTTTPPSIAPIGSVSGSGVSSTLVVRVPSVAYTVSLPHRASGAAVYAPSVKYRAVTATIAVGSTPFAPQLIPAGSVQLAHKASSISLYAPTKVDAALYPPHISSSVVMHRPMMRYNIITASYIRNASLYAPMLDVGPGNQILALPRIASTAVLTEPDLVQFLSAAPQIASTAHLYGVTLRYVVRTGHIGSTVVLRTPRIGRLSGFDPLLADDPIAEILFIANALECNPTWPRTAGDLDMNLVLRRGNDQIVTLPRLRSARDETIFLNGASVTATLIDGHGDVVEVVDMEYVEGTDGDFRWEINGPSFMYKSSTRYKLVIVAEQDESSYRQEFDVSITE